MDDGLEVAVTRVGRSGRRGRWAAIAWATSLVALVAVAIAERPAESGPVPVAVAVPGPHADPGPLASMVRPVTRVVAPRERTTGEDGLMGSLVFDFDSEYPFVLWWPVGNLPWLTNPTQS